MQIFHILNFRNKKRAECQQIRTNISLNCSNDQNRRAIFGTIPEYTAVRPLYRLVNPSRATMRRAISTGPKLAPVSPTPPDATPRPMPALERVAGIVRPPPTGMVPTTGGRLRRSCMRVLMVSRGWQTEVSTRPAAPPARKCSRGCFFFLGGGMAVLICEGCRLSIATVEARRSEARRGVSFFLRMGRGDLPEAGNVARCKPQCTQSGQKENYIRLCY
mmetsp:Transcript_39663/g.92821  ORF Transcript_39663/g.92821 Transcript_39663/m.92821 type:complete len:218 (+) Transcript_39663:1180-1833(+)